MISIVEIMSEITNHVSCDMGFKVNFLFGEWAQIAREMEILGKSPITQSGKWPLLALFYPFEEDKSDPDYYCVTNVDMMIATRTISDYTNKQRLEVSYKKVLWPLYKDLINKIREDKRFDFGSRGVVPHRYMDNMRYGSRGVYGSDGKKPFADLFDGVDIMGLELKVNKKNCR